MNRRSLLKAALILPFLPRRVPGALASSGSADAGAGAVTSRVRPGGPGWPSAAQWDALRQAVGGRLGAVQSPLQACRDAPGGAACAKLLQEMHNPYFVGDDPALTQSSGWLDAWTSQPSAYAVAARETADVVAAVNFAREHRLRLVVKSAGNSYQGTSCAPDSLLVWTRHMNAITLHDAFVAQGCAGQQTPQPAVSVGAGAMWGQVYDAVTTCGGRYVQGAGCLTIGVAGLIQSGGFGSFSKAYGLAAAGLLEAEVVTADGAVRIANACSEPELFWGLKGGGGGSLGVVTRLTLRTRPLPAVFGVVLTRIRAASDADYRELIARILAFYAEHLFNPHWGEQIVFGPGNTLRLNLVFQGLDPAQVRALWQPFIAMVAGSGGRYTVERPWVIGGIPARFYWDGEFLRIAAPGATLPDDRPGAPPGNFYWTGDGGQVSQYHYAYHSAWLPASLLQPSQQARLAEAVFAATRHWSFSLHCNKGLAGALAEEVVAARDTAMHPGVLDAFALAICAGEGPAAFPGVPGHEPDAQAGHRAADAIGKAMAALRTVAPDAGAYVSESDYFEQDWQRSFWGPNYPRLAAVKRRYDPDGLFFVHHGVGSEGWSADGFTRLE